MVTPSGDCLLPRVVGIVVIAVILPRILLAQGTAGSGAKLEPRFLIDMPTAGMPQGGSYAVDVDFYQAGGVLLRLTLGLFDRFSVGMAYGGSRLIGVDPPDMNEIPGIDVRLRILDEGMVFPALVAGFDSQGKDGYNRGLSRYSVKSPGFFAAFSKNTLMLGFLSFHGGVAYSLERTDGDRDMNLFAGIEKTIGPFLSGILEYNAAFNEDGGTFATRGRGYLNAALRWSVGGGLTLGFSLKDIVKNRSGVTIANRTATIEFVHSF